MFVRKANKENRLHLRLQSYAASASDHPSVAAVPSVLQSASVSGEVLWTRRTHNSRHAVVRGKHRRGCMTLDYGQITIGPQMQPTTST